MCLVLAMQAGHGVKVKESRDVFKGIPATVVPLVDNFFTLETHLDEDTGWTFDTMRTDVRVLIAFVAH